MKPEAWQFRIVPTKNGFDAHGYCNGALQGTYWSSTCEKEIVKALAVKYPGIEVI